MRTATALAVVLAAWLLARCLGAGAVGDREPVRHGAGLRGKRRYRSQRDLTGPGAPQTLSTDARGEFRFLSLSPGDYAVLLEKPGFETLRRAVTDQRRQDGDPLDHAGGGGHGGGGDGQRRARSWTSERSRPARPTAGRSSKPSRRPAIPGRSCGRFRGSGRQHQRRRRPGRQAVVLHREGSNPSEQLRPRRRSDQRRRVYADVLRLRLFEGITVVTGGTDLNLARRASASTS